jgi:predicted acyltransferase
MNQPAPNGKTEILPASGRLLSLDVLRGFDMFWIIGADELFRSLSKISQRDLVRFVTRQLDHVQWQGFVFYDLIFPLFLFIIGVSLVFSLDKIIDREGKRAAYKRIIRRGLILFLLGVFYDGGLARIHEENVLCGVLQRLALGYFFTSLLYCNLKLKGLVTTFVLLLVSYWALWTFVPLPGAARVSFEEEKNWTHYVDHLMPPYHRIDNEGYLSTFPAIGTCLLGVFAAFLLKNTSIVPKKKVAWLIGAGAVMTILGYLWGFQFPVIKRAWTSSYVLVAGGYSSMLLGWFYLVVDVWKYQRWAAPFIWIGTNPLTIYLATSVLDVNKVAERLVGGPLALALGRYGDLVVTLVGLGLAIIFVRFLYQKKIFLRV